MSKHYCFYDPNAGCVCNEDPSMPGPSGSRTCNINSSNKDADCCAWQTQNACENASVKPTKSNYDPNGWSCNPYPQGSRSVQLNNDDRGIGVL